MDKRQKRTQAKHDAILETAQVLFTEHGVDNVSVDEIAAQAQVSKVTLYKYFGSKAELYAAVVGRRMDAMLVETEAVFHGDIDFVDKLKFVLRAQAGLTQLVSYSYLFQLWEQNAEVAAQMDASMNQVKALIYDLVEEGKRKGYIDPDLSFEMLYLYAEIFRAGMCAKSIDLESVLADPGAVDQLLNLYFFGLIRQPSAASQDPAPGG